MAASSSSSSSGSMGSKVAIDAFNAACKRLEKKGNVTSEDIVELESLRKGIAAIFEREITTLRGAAGAGTTGAEGLIQSRIKDRDTELTKSDRTIEDFKTRMGSVVFRATGAGAGAGAGAGSGVRAGSGAEAAAGGPAKKVEPGPRIGLTSVDDTDALVYSYLSSREMRGSAGLDKSTADTTKLKLEATLDQLNSLTVISITQAREYQRALHTDLNGVLMHCVNVTHLDVRGITPEEAGTLTAPLPALKVVHCGNAGRLTEPDLIAFVTKYPLLTALGLDSCTKLTNVGITAIGEACHGLTLLYLFGCKNVTNAGIAAFAASCRGLTHLNLRYCNISDVGVIAIAAACRELVSLDICALRTLTDDALYAIAEGCPKLVSLNLRGCQMVTAAGIAAVAARCRGLKSIDAVFCDRLTDADKANLIAQHPTVTFTF